MSCATMNTMISARAFFKGTTTLPTQSKPRAACVVKAVRAEGETKPAATPPPVPKGCTSLVRVFHLLGSPLATRIVKKYTNFSC